MSNKKRKRNNLASRCPVRAGRLRLRAAREQGAISFGSQITHGSRWKVSIESICEFAKVNPESLTREDVLEFGKRLAAAVNDDLKSPAYAQNLISSVNTVMHCIRPWGWVSVSPTEDCGIPKRIAVRSAIPDGMDEASVQFAVQALSDAGEARYSLVVSLVDALGLRVREASMLDARNALDEAIRTGSVTISRGTKGGRTRIVPASSPSALAALSMAAGEQGNRKSLIPDGETYEEFLDGEIQRGRSILKACGIKCPRELRAGWAIRRYREITGFWPPLVSGSVAPDRCLDMKARLQISEELGHHRPDITNAYLGGKNP